MKLAVLFAVSFLAFASLSDAWFFGSSTDTKDEEDAAKVFGEEESLEDASDIKPKPVEVDNPSNDSPTKDHEAPSLVKIDDHHDDDAKSSSSRIIGDDADSAAPEPSHDSSHAHLAAHGHGPSSSSSGAVSDHDAEFDHRAILGSVEKAEEFHHLSPMEAKKRLWALTKKIDADDNGEVTEEELRVSLSFEA